MRNFRFNIVRQAQRVIGRQSFQLRKYLGREVNEAGYFNSKFSDPVEFRGSVQPVVTTQYKSLMLDFSKKYIKVYSVELISQLSREENADQIIWLGDVYHVIPNQRWHEIAGWQSILAVKVGKYERQ